MQLPRDYEQAHAADGSATQVPAGGYVCQIRSAKEEQTASGPRLSVAFDIFEGGYKGIFERRWQQEKGSMNAKWRGMYNLFPVKRDGGTNPFFKGLITAIEKSNPGTTLAEHGQLHEERMKNCVVGLLFREEEFVGQDGEVHVTTRPSMAVEAQRIRSGDYQVPKRRTVEAVEGQPAQQSFTQVETDALPWD